MSGTWRRASTAFYKLAHQYIAESAPLSRQFVNLQTVKELVTVLPKNKVSSSSRSIIRC